MNIVSYFDSENKAALREKIARCDWGAARFLTKLLEEGTFHETLGGFGDLYLLLDGEALVSFATMTGQDSVRDESLTPWIGFVYTTPEYRGRRCAGQLLAHAQAQAAKLGYGRIYIGTDHVGLYEKYGYTYLENRIDCWGDDTRVLYKDLRTIRAMEEAYRSSSLDLVQQVFTDHENEQEGRMVRALVEEIRDMDTYIPELELVMVDDADAPVGYCMFSRFCLNGGHEDELLLLSPVAVRTALQRQHISKRLIEYGFERAREMGFKAVIVEGNPRNYRSRGFETSALYGITAHESVRLPAPECLMVRELAPGGLQGIRGEVEYSRYSALR